MTIEELIEALECAKKNHGNIPVMVLSDYGYGSDLNDVTRIEVKVEFGIKPYVEIKA